jgi:hypothetical protein
MRISPPLSAFVLAATFGTAAVAQTPASAPAAGRPAGGGFNRAHPEPIDWENHEGWTSLFDGKSMTGWEGAADVWHVEDGAIVGVSSDANPSGTTNLIYKPQEFANFRLRLDFKMDGAGANGGVQYRSRMSAPLPRPIPADATPEMKARMEKAAELSKKRAAWAMAGYQADFNYAGQYVGQLYEQSSMRGIMTFPGEMAAFEGGGRKPRLIGMAATADEVKGWYKKDEWNQLEIIADGHTLTHLLNGHIVAVTIDTDPEKMAGKGLIALEIEGGGTLKIAHRNIFIKKLQ